MEATEGAVEEAELGRGEEHSILEPLGEGRVFWEGKDEGRDGGRAGEERGEEGQVALGDGDSDDEAETVREEAGEVEEGEHVALRRVRDHQDVSAPLPLRHGLPILRPGSSLSACRLAF